MNQNLATLQIFEGKALRHAVVNLEYGVTLRGRDISGTELQNVGAVGA